MMNRIQFVLVVLLFGGVAIAQDGKVPSGKLMIELEEILPRKAPVPGKAVAFGHTIDWPAKIDAVGEILAKSANTRVEPHALYVLANCLYNDNQIDAAKVTFEDIKGRFPKHPLCTSAKHAQGSKSLVDAALEDCTDELRFRAKHAIKVLPTPELDPDSETILHLSMGKVHIQFYKNAAPKHRDNFMKLVREGFYDRIRVHRVVPGNIVHMGCPNTRERLHDNWGKGGPGYVLKNEFSRVSHRAGTLTMWRGPGRPDSHGSQFQIILKDQPHLDFVQTPFAIVVKGLDVVENLSRQPRNQYESPTTDCYINGIAIPKAK